MIINRPQISIENDLAYYRVSVESVAGKEILWYTIPSEHAELLSDSSDGALVALLMPAMEKGEDIFVDGTVSERLLHNLSGPLQEILQLQLPFLKKISITVKEINENRTIPPKGVATGFSGGVDSSSVLYNYCSEDTSPGYRITHLLFNNVGSHGKKGEPLFEKRYKELASAAESLGLPFLKINSNLDSFYNRRIDFLATHNLRNGSVPLMLQNGIGRFMYASAYDFPQVAIGPGDDSICGEPILVPYLSTETLDAISTGNEFTRVEKTLQVMTLPQSREVLSVCISEDDDNRYVNCGSCSKCLRTLATLDIAGCIEDYASMFDLKPYGRQKKRYFARLLSSNDPYMREIVEFAKEKGYRFPISSHIIKGTGFFPFKSLLKRVSRKFKARFKKKH
jgi:7-cyano-7-deazaguanine synthase in queuosine biosynthesis